MSAVKAEGKKVIKFGVEDLNLKPDDPRYKSGMHCLRTYWSQATTLETHEQEEMIEYLRKHDYYLYTTPSARITATSHKLYQATMRAFDALGLEGLSRPIYLILSALYTRLPRQYLQLIKDRFGTLDIINHSQEYRRAISSAEGAQVTATVASYANLRSNQIMTDEPAVATDAATIRNKNEENVASSAGQQVAVLDPERQAKQSVALEEAKRPRALSDTPAIEPKRIRRATDDGDFDSDHVVAGVKSSLAV